MYVVLYMFVAGLQSHMVVGTSESARVVTHLCVLPEIIQTALSIERISAKLTQTMWSQTLSSSAIVAQEREQSIFQRDIKWRDEISSHN